MAETRIPTRDELYKALNPTTRYGLGNVRLPQTAPTAPRQIDRAAVLRALANQKQPDSGLFAGAMGVAKRGIMALDIPRSVIASGLQEVVDVFQGEGFSAQDFVQQARSHHRFQDVLADVNVDFGLGGWGNKIIGLAGDVAMDPLMWIGGLGAFARARGARGLVEEMSFLRQDLRQMVSRTAAQDSQLAAVEAGIVAAGNTRTVSAARNALKKHGTVGQKLIDDLGIETGLRMRLPGTGPVLGRLSKNSAWVARRRATQVPKLVSERVGRQLPEGVTMEGMIRRAMKRKTLSREIPLDARRVALQAARVPVEFVPKLGGIPIASGVTAHIMASPGIGFEKIATSRFGQSLGKYMADPQKMSVAALRRSSNPDDIILSNFMKNGYNRGSTYSALWAEEAQRGREGFLNNVRTELGITDDLVLDRLTQLPWEHAEAIRAGTLSEGVAARLAADFPTLDTNQIARVMELYKSWVAEADVKFLLRADLYGAEGRLAVDMDDLLLAYGAYTPHVVSGNGRAILEEAFGGLTQHRMRQEGLEWVADLLDEVDDLVVRASTVEEIRARATSRHLQRRTWKPSHVNREGVYEKGTTLRIPVKGTTDEWVTVRLRRPAVQSDMGLGPLEGMQRGRPLTGPEIARRRQYGRAGAHEEGLPVLRQIDDAFRQAGWLDDADSLFVQGFAARERAYISSLSRDVRLRAIEMYAGRQGLAFNADTFLQFERGLQKFDEATALMAAQLRGLDEQEEALRISTEAILRTEGATPREWTLDNLARWIRQNGEQSEKLVDDIAEIQVQQAHAYAELLEIQEDLLFLGGDLDVLMGVGWGVLPDTGVVDALRFTAGRAMETPGAYMVDAVRGLLPIMSELDKVLTRYGVLKEGMARISALSQRLGDEFGGDLTLGPRPNVASREMGAQFPLESMLDDMEDVAQWLEDGLIPQLRNRVDEVMGHDASVQALKRTRDSIALAGQRPFAGGQPTAYELAEQFNAMFNSSPHPSYNVPRRADGRIGLDDIQRETLEQSAHPNKDLIERILDDMSDFSDELFARIGRHFDFEMNNGVPGQENVTWSLGGAHGTNALTDAMTLGERGKAAQLIGRWLDSTILYDADRLGAIVSATVNSATDMGITYRIRLMQLFENGVRSTSQAYVDATALGSHRWLFGRLFPEPPGGLVANSWQRNRKLVPEVRDWARGTSNDAADVPTLIREMVEEASETPLDLTIANNVDQLRTYIVQMDKELSLGRSRMQMYGRAGFKRDDGQILDAAYFWEMPGPSIERAPTAAGEIRGAQGGLVLASGEPDILARGIWRRQGDEVLERMKVGPDEIPDGVDAVSFRVLRQFERTMERYRVLEGEINHEYLAGLWDDVEAVHHRLVETMETLELEARNILGSPRTDLGPSTVGHPAYTRHQRMEGYTDYPDAPAEPVSLSFFDDNVDFMLGNDAMGNRLDRVQPQATRQRIDDIKDSVRRNGFEEPIRLDYDPVYGTIDVAEGNHRLIAARELGFSDVPVIVHIMPSAEVPPTWFGTRGTPRSPKVPPMADDQVQRHLAHPRNANRVSNPDTVFHRASVSPSEVGIPLNRRHGSIHSRAGGVTEENWFGRWISPIRRGVMDDPAALLAAREQGGGVGWALDNASWVRFSDPNSTYAELVARASSFRQRVLNDLERAMSHQADAPDMFLSPEAAWRTNMTGAPRRAPLAMPEGQVGRPQTPGATTMPERPPVGPPAPILREQIDLGPFLQHGLPDAVPALPNPNTPQFWEAVEEALGQSGALPTGGYAGTISDVVEMHKLITMYDELVDGATNRASWTAQIGIIDDFKTRAAELQRRLGQVQQAKVRNQGRLDARVQTMIDNEEAILQIGLQRQQMELELAAIQGRKAEYATNIGKLLGPENGKAFNLNSFGGDVDLSNITVEMLQDMFSETRHMWGAWRLAGDEKFADQFTYAMLAAQKMNDKREVKGLLLAYDRVHNWMKAQMVATPGFVTRNIMGGMTNMWFEGIPLSETLRAGKLLRKAYGAGDGDLLKGARALVRSNADNPDYLNLVELLESGAHAGGQAAAAVETNLRGKHAMDWVFGTKNGAAKGHRINMNPGDAGFVLFSAVRHANTFAEEMLRLGTGLHAMRVGGSLDDALETIYRLHFNYGDLSSWERQVGRRVFPFYTWTRNNLPLQLTFAARHPQKYNRLLSLKGNLEYGEEREGVVPDYFLQPFGIQMPFAIQGATAYSVPDMPFQDLFRYDPSEEGFGRTLEQIVSSASPMIKAPIEYWAGKQVFAGIPYSGRYQQAPKTMTAVPFLMDILGGFGWAKKDQDGEWKMQDQRIALIDNLLPYIGRLRRVLPSEDRYQRRYLQTLLSTLGGVNLRLNTPQVQQSELMRRQIEQSLIRRDVFDIEHRRR